MGGIDIKHLRMIRATVGTGNMTKAAQRLCIGQSGLSPQPWDIEKTMAVALFSGHPKGGSPLPQAIGIAGSGEPGKLRIGTQGIFCYRWLPHVIMASSASSPVSMWMSAMPMIRPKSYSPGGLTSSSGR